MWKKVVLITIIIMLFLSRVSFSDEFYIGGSWPVKGHSESGDYGINNGDKDSYAIAAGYEYDLFEAKSNTLGVNPVFSYKLLRWWKDEHNQNDEQVVDSHIYMLYLKPYYMFDNLKLFALIGTGYEVAVNESNELTVGYGVGFQYYFSRKFSLSYSYQKVYSNPEGDYRRYGMDFVVTANFRF